MAAASSSDAVIRKVYYNLQSGFGSIAKTHKAAQQVDPAIKKADVKAYLDKQEIRQGKKRRGDNSFIPYAPREEYQFDLADFGASAVKFRYAFIAIDAFSKMLQVVPLENKTPAETVRALNIVIEKMHIPQYAYTDDGGEFKGGFDERLKYFFMQHLITRSHAIFAERVIRTLREGLIARMKATRTDKAYWWKLVGNVVDQYNEAVHVTTGEAPNDIHHLSMEKDKEWIEEIRGRIEGKGRSNRKYAPISVGDRVKVSRKPGKYGEFKTGFQAWSAETYRVTKIEYIEGSPMFHLEGREYDHRPFSLHEILKVDGVEKPLATRVTSKREPGISVRKVPVAPKKVRLRQKTTVTAAPMMSQGAVVVQRTRLREKTHPLADQIAS